MKIQTLKRPAEFRRVRGGARWVTPIFIIEGRRRPVPVPDAPVLANGARFGFTITRKIGGAVVRNRIRRRLREALRTLDEAVIRADHDYVLVASRAAHDYPFAELKDVLRTAFERLHRHADDGSGRGKRSRTASGDGRQPKLPKAGTSQTGPSKTGPSKTGASKSGQSESGRSGNGQSESGPGKTGSSKGGPSKPAAGSPGRETGPGDVARPAFECDETTP